MSSSASILSETHLCLLEISVIGEAVRDSSVLRVDEWPVKVEGVGEALLKGGEERQ